MCAVTASRRRDAHAASPAQRLRSRPARRGGGLLGRVRRGRSRTERPCAASSAATAESSANPRRARPAHRLAAPGNERLDEDRVAEQARRARRGSTARRAGTAASIPAAGPARPGAAGSCWPGARRAARWSARGGPAPRAWGRRPARAVGRHRAAAPAPGGSRGARRRGRRPAPARRATGGAGGRRDSREERPLEEDEAGRSTPPPTRRTTARSRLAMIGWIPKRRSAPRPIAAAETATSARDRRPASGGAILLAGRSGRNGQGFDAPAPSRAFKNGREEIDRQREERRGVPLRGDLAHRLEVAELHGDGGLRQDVGRLRELRGRLELALRVDDLGPPLALGLGLLGHRALHVLREVDVLDLDRRHLHAPGLGVLVDDPLELLVDLVARRRGGRPAPPGRARSAASSARSARSRRGSPPPGRPPGAGR